jgi:beta-N-acetylhexosaminidase
VLDDIGRCIMVGVRGARPDDDALRRDLDACRECRCRAIALFDRDAPSGGGRNIESPGQLRELIAFIRETLGPDILVAIDQEGGTVQRLRASTGFVETPSAWEFASLSTDARRDIARTQAAQLRDLGIDLNFAPCVDVAINPSSPIIATRGRSFGVDPNMIVECANEVIAAHLDARVVPCLKHFPGHGSAREDSHLGMPDITECWDDAVETAPFVCLINKHDPICVMTAHLLHRRIDAEAPASLSRAWTTGLLRERLGFTGVIITDSLDMRAIADRFPSGDAAAWALIAGADLALDANNMPGATRACPAPLMAESISRALEDGRIDPLSLAQSACRVDALTAFTGRGARAAAPPHA